MNFGLSEMLFVAFLGLLFVGPKRLPQNGCASYYYCVIKKERHKKDNLRVVGAEP